MKNLSAKVTCSAVDSDPRSGQAKTSSSTETPAAPTTRFRIKGSTMAKYSSVAVLLAILVIVVLVVLSESASTRQVKKVVTRRKKVPSTSTTTPAPTTLLTTTTIPTTTTTEATTTVSTPEAVLLAETESSVFSAVDEEAALGNPDSSESSREESFLVSSQEDEAPPSSTVASSSRRRNAARGSLVIPEDCPECIEHACASPVDSNCPMGLVLDRCSCCFICAASEGNRCYNASLKIPYNPDIRNQLCGPGLSCLLRGDLEPNEPPESLCECRDKRKVCGSDGVTYFSECKLREAAHTNPALIVKAWRPCVSAPVIPSPMDNVTVAAGEDASLSCEVRSFPHPVIHWEFLAENSLERTVLPGDDSSIVVTIRGGPEEQLTSSYLQIVSVTPRVQGMYFCIGKNNEGTAQTVAFVSVYNKFTGIETQK